MIIRDFCTHNWQIKFRLLVLVAIVSLLSACAAGKMFMAGYTPPQTIADLLAEQYDMAGESLPPELDADKRGGEEISIGLYGKNDNKNDNANIDGLNRPQNIQNQAAYIDTMPPVQRFRPRFTYKSVQDYASQLAMELIKNANGLRPQAAIAVTSFVKLDYSLQNTTILGNQMAEYAITEIQQYGLNVIDFKLMPAISVGRNGDLSFSRDLTELASQNTMDHVLSATMIEKADGVFINARIIAMNTNRVVSSASVMVPNFVAKHSQARYVLN
jgi:TolB-like protein